MKTKILESLQKKITHPLVGAIVVPLSLLVAMVGLSLKSNPSFPKFNYKVHGTTQAYKEIGEAFTSLHLDTAFYPLEVDGVQAKVKIVQTGGSWYDGNPQYKLICKLENPHAKKYSEKTIEAWCEEDWTSNGLYSTPEYGGINHICILEEEIEKVDGTYELKKFAYGEEYTDKYATTSEFVAKVLKEMKANFVTPANKKAVAEAKKGHNLEQQIIEEENKPK